MNRDMAPLENMDIASRGARSLILTKRFSRVVAANSFLYRIRFAPFVDINMTCVLLLVVMMVFLRMTMI